ncbi:hypothetical protein SXCC_00041 [Gluconacetobacter sp. SXCC-1]|nr:hypothetical protein SXCC_00041 [Gluconacetobacter sp. SXCC-1]
MTPDLRGYDHIIVALSGGKDSVASLLAALELGARPESIELWHHDVDGGGVHGLALHPRLCPPDRPRL